MKKIMITSLLVITCSFYTKAQTTIFSEDFESGIFPPTGWVSLQEGSGNLWTEMSYGIPAHGGTGGAAEYKYDDTYNANAWLISPGITLTSGTTYIITYWEKTESYSEKLKVTVGTTQETTSQTTILQDLGSHSASVYTKRTTTFTPITNDTYYFGWNCYSDADTYYLNIDDISITQAITNDECSNATTLTVGGTCNYESHSTAGCTASGTLPLPSCAGSTFNDIWFKFIVPASGHVIIRTQSGEITDGGMEIYSGTCDNLSAIECDDDGSENGMMPLIKNSTLTPGATIYVRFWDYDGDKEGTFSICVCEILPCATNSSAADLCGSATLIGDLNGYCGNTSDEYYRDTPGDLLSNFCGTIENNSWLKFMADNDTAVLDVYVSNCLNNDGIQIAVFKTSDCNTFIAYPECWNPAKMVDGIVTVTGLTVGQMYYLMIDGYSGDVCDFMIAASSGVNLPISLASFTVNCKNNNAIINWTTASETNNDYFTIEKSNDLVNWQFVQKIAGAINGNSNQLINYKIVDEAVSDNIYYRLKQTDYDGKFEIFSPIVINCENNNNPTIKVYPNPTTDVLNIKTSDINIIEIEIIDMIGKTILKSIDNLKIINMSDFKLGIYTLKIKDDRDKISIFKIVKK